MIAVIDYGMGNLASVHKALQRAGGDARLVRTAGELLGASKIVLPGVAAFGDAIEQLRRQGLVEPIVQAVRGGVPYLGFCLGLQMLFNVSYELGQHTGLGLLTGKVVRFDWDGLGGRRLAVPHMGWNQLRLRGNCPLFRGIADGAYAYFAHSYHVVPMEDAVVAATTDYGYDFVSAVWKDNIFATQFHPEKSQAVGLQILSNFVSL
ncbi:MAG: imidazole glycerol phosphate synthase subunit HisH [Planctomycetaceae bacterium]|nr:imidazole glycerol phosphate synthase subunit HisH [Planctomycetaceae bacterium]